MSSAETKDKDRAEDILDVTIKSERLSHAYLFFGPQKVIMEKVALKFAKALNCLRQGNGLDSCERCLSCRKIEHFNHPDIGHIHAEGGSRQIKIEQIRNLQKDAHLKPIEAQKKVYIIYEAELMTTQASNCLLKTLEEPPRDVIIILISLNLSSLLPTIISRCQIIKFSQSRYAEKSDEEKEAFIDEFLSGQDPFSSETLEFVKRPKSDQLKTVDLLSAYFRDVLVYKFLGEDSDSKGPDSLLLNPKRLKSIRRMSQQYTVENILILMKEFLNSKDLLQSNVNPKMVVDSILDSIVSLRVER